MSNRRLLGAAALLSSVSSWALAQTPPPDVSPSPPISEQASPDDGQQSALEQVIVTAQRREQRLIDVPASVSYIGADQLNDAAVGNVMQLGQTTPGMTMYKTGAYTQPTIRGIGTSVVGPGADANVSLYVDGFYLPSQLGNNFDLNNIQSVEVLKGPQGTLFGRNATGGAILIKTKLPEFDFSGDAGISYESYNDRRGNLYLTGGLTSTIAADVAVVLRQADGYVEDIYTGDDWAPIENTLIRSRVLFQPNDTFQAILGLEHNEVSDGNNNVGVFINGRWRALRPDLEHANAPFEASQTFKPDNSTNTDAINLTTTTDLGAWGELKTYSQYRDEDLRNLADVDGSPLPLFAAFIVSNEKTMTQEVTLSQKLGRVDLLGGLYYFDDEFSTPNYTTISSANGLTTTTTSLNTNVDTIAYAAFVDGTVALTDRFSLTLGGRYSVEKKDLYGKRPPSAPSWTVDVSTEWSSFTPRAVLAYEIDDRSNIYGSYTEGFKSGNYNANSLDPIPVKPEEIRAWEIGYKSLLSGFLVSTSAFYYDWENVQLTSWDYVQSRGRLLNAAAAEVYGAEFELSGDITDTLSGRVGMTYTHAEYTDFANAVVFVPVGNDMGNSQIIADRSGYQLQRTPKVQASAQLTYAQPLANGELKWSGAVSYQSKTFLNGYRTTQPAYALANVSATWTAPNGRYDIGVFCKNLFDKEYFIYINETGLGDNLIWGAPRSVGVRLGAHF
jgi:iron complex outermembrane receptor protein